MTNSCKIGFAKIKKMKEESFFWIQLFSLIFFILHNYFLHGFQGNFLVSISLNTHNKNYKIIYNKKVYIKTNLTRSSSSYPVYPTHRKLWLGFGRKKRWQFIPIERVRSKSPSAREGYSKREKSATIHKLAAYSPR